MKLKQQIIIKSQQLFERNGIKVVTMDDIASSMGISKKTLYAQFSGKEDLINAVIEHLFEGHFYVINTILNEHHTFTQKINTIYEYAVNYLIQVSPVFHLDLKKYYTPSHKTYEKYRREIVFGIVKKLLDEGQLNGEVDPSINTKLFCEFHLINFDKIFTTNPSLDTISVKELLDHTIGISLRGIFKNKIDI